MELEVSGKLLAYCVQGPKKSIPIMSIKIIVNNNNKITSVKILYVLELFFSSFCVT